MPAVNIGTCSTYFSEFQLPRGSDSAGSLGDTGKNLQKALRHFRGGGEGGV